METVKTSTNVEFDVIYADGTRKRVHEGVLLEVEDQRMVFHNGTNRKSVLFASVEALFEIITALGLENELDTYLEQAVLRDLGKINS